MTYGCAEPIVPPAREGHRLKFSEADKRRIVEEAVRADVRGCAKKHS
jgi:transposase-like protein